jgi:probable F420-dependent oxidoreductase
VELCRRADELGYSSLWTLQRLLYPRGTFLGDAYRSVMDPMVALGFIASCTTRARLGVGVVNAPFVSPVLLAKQAATVDVLSGGRLTLGIGVGWSPDEFAAAGADMARRGDRLEEYLRYLDALFSGAPDFRGEFYEIPPSEVGPVPVQKPRPHLLIGAMVPAALRRAGRCADGWITSSSNGLEGGLLESRIEVVRQGAAEAGKDPEAVEIVVRGQIELKEVPDPERRLLTGAIDEIRNDIESLAGLGVTEVVIDLNFDPAISRPGADVAASVETAHRVLEAFAPTRAS